MQCACLLKLEHVVDNFTGPAAQKNEKFLTSILALTNIFLNFSIYTNVAIKRLLDYVVQVFSLGNKRQTS